MPAPTGTTLIAIICAGTSIFLTVCAARLGPVPIIEGPSIPIPGAGELTMALAVAVALVGALVALAAISLSLKRRSGIRLANAGIIAIVAALGSALFVGKILWR